MRAKLLILTAAVAMTASPLPAWAAASGFRLPPSPSEQQRQQPERQGPVAPDVPESRQPAPTRAPPASTPTLTPEVIPPAIAVPQPIEATPEAPAPQRTQTATPRPAAQQSTVELPSDPVTETLLPEPVGEPAITAGPSPIRPAPAGNGSDFPWLWALAGLLAVGLAGLALWWWRREAGVIEVPEIERPRVVPSALPPKPAAPPPVVSGEPLQVALEPQRLSLTLLNATLTWRLELSNAGPTPLTGLVIGADMISAHASMTKEEQLSGPGASPAVADQRIDRLEPGESHTLSGEFRLPLSQIVPIRQGKAALLLPLARFRVEADGSRPLVRTFAVGQPGSGAGLQPFRLDEGPRIFPHLIQRAFA